MKTSGFRCETKFGLLVFLGHPIQYVLSNSKEVTSKESLYPGEHQYILESSGEEGELEEKFVHPAPLHLGQ